jgi:glycosyl transferase family 25
MRTYIINLERSVRRREHIVAEVGKFGLDHEIVPAVDGTKFTEEEVVQIADMERVRMNPDWLTPTMLATALSHRKVFERILENGDKYALILEDDAEFSDDPRPLLDSIKPVLRKREVALLHYFSFAPLGISTVGSERIHSEKILAYPLALRGLVSAAAYVITQDGARSLYDSVVPVSTASDAWVDFFESGWLDAIRIVHPRPVEVIGAKSTINAAAQSRLRSIVTELVDKYRIPILHDFLRRQRLRKINAMSEFFLTEEAPESRQQK